MKLYSSAICHLVTKSPCHQVTLSPCQFTQHHLPDSKIGLRRAHQPEIAPILAVAKPGVVQPERHAMGAAVAYQRDRCAWPERVVPCIILDPEAAGAAIFVGHAQL